MCLTHTESRCFVGNSDGSISIIDLTHPLDANVIGGSGEEDHVTMKSGHTDSITWSMCILAMMSSLSITGDDGYLISGGKDGCVFVWDANSLQTVKEYKGGNASSKGKETGSKEKEVQDASIVFLEVIPYPTLLFESKTWKGT